MTRVHVICEGQTEETFINKVLAPYFEPKGIYLYPSLIGKPGHKGGNFKIERFTQDLEKRLLRDPTAYCTCLFDFYGLPEKFPGKASAISKATTQKKSEELLSLLGNHLRGHLGPEAMNRFIPYVQMYEFEGLLFSSPKGLAEAIDKPDLIVRFQEIRNEFPTPEDINNSPETAPSKRMEALFPGYEKVIHGTLGALQIGLEKIRQECSIFNQWLCQIERLAPEADPAKQGTK